MSIRHPLARLYSAWHDKCRKDHPWLKYIKRFYGKYLDVLEQKNMTEENYAYSFDALAELVALTSYDFQRDKHWVSMYEYCSPCQFDYEFITKQETADEDHEAILSRYTAKYPRLHVPSANKSYNYHDATLDISKLAEPYKNLSKLVIQNLYKSYYV